MTDTEELEDFVRDSAVTDAVALIDQGLNQMAHRDLVSGDEVADLLLDVRTLLTSTSAN